jgi:hypothetical protein
LSLTSFYAVQSILHVLFVLRIFRSKYLFAIGPMLFHFPMTILNRIWQQYSCCCNYVWNNVLYFDCRIENEMSIYVKFERFNQRIVLLHSNNLIIFHLLFDINFEKVLQIFWNVFRLFDIIVYAIYEKYFCFILKIWNFEAFRNNNFNWILKKRLNISILSQKCISLLQLFGSKMHQLLLMFEYQKQEKVSQCY